MKLKQLPFLFMPLLIAACNLDNVNLQNVKYKTIVKDATFKLNIPEFLDSTTRLNKEAILQFANGPKELYMMVFSEKKEGLRANLIVYDSLHTITDSTSTMDAYSTYMMNHFTKEDDYKMFNESSTNIKKGSVKRASVTMTLEKTKVFYRVATIEANANFYQVYIWTLDSKKEKYQPIMDSIINSLHEF